MQHGGVVMVAMISCDACKTLISETKITTSNLAKSVPKIPGYNFEFVPTPLASGGVALFIDDRHSYRILEKASNEAFQALWVEISFVKKKNIICGVIYASVNSSGAHPPPPPPGLIPRR